MTGPADQDRMIAAAYEAAAQSMRLTWAQDRSIDERTQVGRLTDKELVWMASMAISNWINERNRQWSSARKGSLDDFIAQYEPGTNPKRRADLMAALPDLGKWCAERSLTDKTITQWSRDDVVAFLELSWELAGLVKISREETPDFPSEAEDYLRAG